MTPSQVKAALAYKQAGQRQAESARDDMEVAAGLKRRKEQGHTAHRTATEHGERSAKVRLNQSGRSRKAYRPRNGGRGFGWSGGTARSANLVFAPDKEGAADTETEAKHGGTGSDARRGMWI